MASTPLYTLASQNWWEADGSQTVWNFSFAGGYIDKSHVKAWYRAPDQQVPTAIAVTEDMFIGDYQLNITPPVPAGYVLAIYRATPKVEPLVNFQDGAQVSEVSLDTNAQQAIFAAAETSDAVTLAVLDPSGITLDAVTTAAGQVVDASITSLRADLASISLASKGAGMIGYSDSRVYPANTVGGKLQALAAGGVGGGGGSGGETTWVAQTFTMTAAQTSVTLSNAPPNAAACDVSLNGATLFSPSDYTVSGTTLTLTAGADAGDQLHVRFGLSVPPGAGGANGDTITLVGPLLHERNLTSKVTETLSTQDYGVPADGLTDGTTALINAINNTPDYGTLIIKGYVRITAPISINRPVSLVCPEKTDAIIADVGTGQDAVTYTGGAAGLNGLDIRLNIYGKANSCRYGLVLSRVDRSQVYAHVYCGGATYGVVLRGMLINRVHIESTVNYVPPFVGSQTIQTDHVLIEKNTTHNVATNANEIWVNLEGRRHGIVMTAQSGEGMNHISGCIEGLTGRPFIVATQRNLHVSNIWLEANAQASQFSDCDGLILGPAIWSIGPGDADIELAACRMPVVRGAYGPRIRPDGATKGLRYADSYLDSDPDSLTFGQGAGASAEDDGPTHFTGAAGQVYRSLYGTPSMENLYVNPYFDIWPYGGSDAPAGVVLNSCTVTRSTTGVYPEARTYRAQFTQTLAGVANGPFFPVVTAARNWQQDRAISFMLAIYVPAGQPNVLVYCPGGTELVSIVTAKDQWVVVRGGALMTAGSDAGISLSCQSGTGTFYVGGLSIVNGTRAPKHLCDHGKRAAYIVPSILAAPTFIGQQAIVGTTAYVAVGTSAPSDWKQIT